MHEHEDQKLISTTAGNRLRASCSAKHPSPRCKRRREPSGLHLTARSCCRTEEKQTRICMLWWEKSSEFSPLIAQNQGRGSLPCRYFRRCSKQIILFLTISTTQGKNQMCNFCYNTEICTSGTSVCREVWNGFCQRQALTPKHGENKAEDNQLNAYPQCLNPCSAQQEKNGVISVKDNR